MTISAFQAAFDRLHREMQLVLRVNDMTFDRAVDAVIRRGLVTVDEARVLDRCRALRNFMAHSNDLIADRLVRIDIDATLAVRLVTMADRLAKRVPSSRFVVPWSQVRCGVLDEPAEPLMAEMIERDFSYVPVVAEGRVCAIFDERCVFRTLASDRLDAITPETRLRDTVEAGAFVRAAPEEAGVIFVGRKASLTALRARLAEAARGSDRIFLIIVTETGDTKQAPLGLATIWDLPEHE